jgi:hypothetical protein
MAFIHKYSTISKGNSFQKGVFDSCNTLYNEIIYPSYKENIPGINLRRMSNIVKMGLANTLKCLEQKKADAIVVGTGLGSINHTELFLSSYIKSNHSILSPTPFINSVHNTISGEIALHTQSKGYNSTYSQSGLSFEGALLDTILLTKEGKKVIVGGVDESIPILDEILNKLETNNLFQTGSSFFYCTPSVHNSLAEVTHCIISKYKKIKSILENLNFNKDEDFIVSGNSFCNPIDLKTFDYSKFCGIYMTNSSFGLQFAVEILNSTQREIDGFTIPENCKRVFIINYASKTNVGVIVVRK